MTPVLRAALIGLGTLGAAGVLAGCGSSGSGADLFRYDTDAPLDVTERERVDAGHSIAVHDLTYASGDDRVEAFLVVPPDRGRRPAVLYLHAASSDRTQLLEAALWMAARGAVTMTITAPSVLDPPASLPAPDALARFGAQAARDVVAARRALDVLAARPDVDAERLGVVGWSAGGRAAAVLAGADARLRAVVLLAPGAAPVSEFVAAAPPELRDDVEKTMTRIDPFAAIGRATGAVLVQAGRADRVVPASAIEALVAAAPDDVELRWYEADHALDASAYREHLDWLDERLSAGPPVSGAPTGP